MTGSCAAQYLRGLGGRPTTETRAPCLPRLVPQSLFCRRMGTLETPRSPPLASPSVCVSAGPRSRPRVACRARTCLSLTNSEPD
jgi:hypothetical protein